jgi:hypothetical protein
VRNLQVWQPLPKLLKQFRPSHKGGLGAWSTPVHGP